MSSTPRLPGAPPAAAVVVRADGSWFDAGPGVLSGYIGGAGYNLGLILNTERPILKDGDYVQVRQAVDLTGVDLASLVASMTGLAVPSGFDLPGYSTDEHTLLHYKMNEVAVGARDDVDWRHDLRVDGGEVGCVIPTYGTGYGLERSWGSGAGCLFGAAAPAVIPVGGLTEYTLDWWQSFDVDSIAASAGVHPVIFQLRSVTAGGLRVRWAGTPGPGSHSWQLQVEHWNASLYHAQSAAATLRAANAGNEFFSVSYDSTTGTARIYLDGVLVATTAALAHAPGEHLLGARIQVGDPLYRGTIDAVRFSDSDRGLGGHIAAYATRLGTPRAVTYRWILCVIIDGTEYARGEVTPDAVARPVYLNAPVFHLSGVHDVACRLSLEAV
jgi:hypothetical protein